MFKKYLDKIETAINDTKTQTRAYKVQSVQELEKAKTMTTEKRLARIGLVKNKKKQKPNTFLNYYDAVEL